MTVIYSRSPLIDPLEWIRVMKVYGAGLVCESVGVDSEMSWAESRSSLGQLFIFVEPFLHDNLS